MVVAAWRNWPSQTTAQQFSAAGTTGNLAISSTFLLEYFYKAAAYDDADDNISFLF